MTWQERVSPIKVGDKVAFSKSFLQSTGQQTGDIPFARGVVTDLKTLGDTVLASIDWDCPDCAPKANVRNLVRVTERGIMDRE